jgi:hypothetical protein
MPRAPYPSGRPGLDYRLIQPSESYGEVVTELQARSGPGVIVVVLDLDQGWNVEEAAGWIRSFRLEYQQRLPVYTGQKDYWRPDRKAPFRPVPIVRVSKMSVTPGERAELVGAGAGVYDRSSPTNKDCQTPEQMLDRFAALATNGLPAGGRLVDPRPDVNADAYNDYPPGIEPGMLDEVLRGNLNAPSTQPRCADYEKLIKAGNIVFRFDDQPTQEQQKLIGKDGLVQPTVTKTVVSGLPIELF